MRTWVEVPLNMTYQFFSGVSVRRLPLSLNFTEAKDLIVQGKTDLFMGRNGKAEVGSVGSMFDL